MPTRPRIAGRERRVYALICALPLLGRVDGALQLRHDDRVVSGGPRPGVRLAGRRSARVRLRQPALGGRAAATATRSPGTRGSSQLRGHYAFHATACTPATPREKGSVEGAVRYHKTGFWPARRFGSLAELDERLRRLARPGRAAAPPRDRPAHRRRAARASSARRCGRCRRSRSTRPGGALAGPAGRLSQARRQLLPRARRRWSISASSCALTATGLDRASRPDRRALPAQLRRRELAAGAAGCAPNRRPVAPIIPIAVPTIVPPALADYAELCA